MDEERGSIAECTGDRLEKIFEKPAISLLTQKTTNFINKNMMTCRTPMPFTYPSPGAPPTVMR
jgi:hypothetical protein